MKTRKTRTPKRVELINMEDFPEFSTRGLIPLEKWDNKWKPQKRENWKKKASKFLKVLISNGTNREDSKEILGISERVYDSVEAYLFETDALKYCAMSIPQRYYIYALQMESSVGQLNDYIRINKHGDPTKTNIIGAVKAVAQFRKDVIKTGQELNVIDSKAKQINVLGDINLSVLPNDELKKLMIERMQKFANIVETTESLSGPYSSILSRSVKQLEEKEEVKEKELDDDFLEADYEQVL